MQNSSNTGDKRAPLCGALSVAAPFVAVAAGSFALFYVRSHPSGSMRLDHLALVGLPTFGSLVCGLILAGAAAVRNERLWALRWIGFVVNGGPLLYLMIASAL